MKRAIVSVLVLTLVSFAACRKDSAKGETERVREQAPRATVSPPSWSEPAVTSESYRRAWNEAAGELFDLRWSFDRARPFEIDVDAGDITMPASGRARFGQAETGPTTLSPEIVRALDLVAGRLEEKRRAAVARALSTQIEAHASFDLRALPEPYARAAAILSEAAPHAWELYLKQNHPQAPEFERELIRGGDTDSIRFFRRAGGPLSERFGDKLYANAMRNFPDRMTAAAMWPDAMTEALLGDMRAKGGEGRNLLSPFTAVKRTEAGELISIPYSAYPPFSTSARAISKRLEEAASVEGIDPAFKKQIEELSRAVASEKAYPFDEALSAWALSRAPIELLVGPFGATRDPFGVKNFYGFVLATGNGKGDALVAKIAPLYSDISSALRGISRAQEGGAGVEFPDIRPVDVIFASGFAAADGGASLIIEACPEGSGCEGKKLVAVNHHEAYAPVLKAVAQAALAPAFATQVDPDSMLLFTVLKAIAADILREAPVSGALPADDARALSLAREWASTAVAARILSGRGAIGEGDERKFFSAWLAGLFEAVRESSESPRGKAALAMISYLAWHGAIKEQGTRFAIVQERVGPVVDSMLSLVSEALFSGSADRAAEFLSSYPARSPDNVSVALLAMEQAGAPRGVAIYYSLTGLER